MIEDGKSRYSFSTLIKKVEIRTEGVESSKPPKPPKPPKLRVKKKGLLKLFKRDE